MADRRMQFSMQTYKTYKHFTGTIFAYRQQCLTKGLEFDVTITADQMKHIYNELDGGALFITALRGDISLFQKENVQNWIDTNNESWYTS